jgi:CDP-diacylglycerol---glycerol-3-phosphate 3-phosphatidyltransferase
MSAACSRTIVGTMATSLGEAERGPSPVPTRERFWNLPNTITVVRMAVVPVLVGFPLYDGPVGSRVVAWLFIIAAFGDLLDGWAARRGSQVTKIGKLLDPLADKLTVATALIVLLAMGRIPDWGLVLVVVVIGRELAVTGLRGIASAGGQVVAAGWQGKLKTTAQNIAVGCLLFPEGTLGVPNHPVGVTLLAVATALTLWSGWVYFADYFGAEERG